MRKQARSLGPISLACAVALAAGFPTSGRAQDPSIPGDWRLTRFTAAHRLPSEAVSHLVESSSGLLWAATEQGLAWFDGWIWHPLPADPGGVPQREVHSLVRGRADTMLAIVHTLLFVGDNSGFRKLPVLAGGSETQVRSAVQLGDGILALVRRESEPAASLVLVRQDSARPFPSPAPLDRHRTPQLFPSASGGAWLAAGRGLWHWDGAAWRLAFDGGDEELVVAFLAEDPSSGRGLASIAAPAGLAGLWTWNRGGAFRRQRTEGVLAATAVAFGPQADIVVHRSGHVRIHQDGAWRSLGEGSPVFADARAALFDRRGDLWIGSGTGLWLHRSGSRLWRTDAIGFPDLRDHVNALLPMPDGSTWAGTANGINVYGADSSIRHIGSVRGSPLGIITGLARDSSGTVWVSGSSFEGAYRWDGREWRHVGPGDGLRAERVHAITVDGAGRVWFLGISRDADGSGPGAFVLEDGRFTRWGVDEGLPSGRVYAFAEGPDGSRWFGTAGGLSRWRNGAWTHWTVRRGTRGGMNFRMPFRVFTLAVDRTGRPWFGGGDPGDYAYGLGTVNASDSLEFISTVDGLIDNQVWGVLLDEDQGTIWVTTEAGVSALRDGIHFHFGSARGLGFSQVWPMILREGRLTIGTLGGGIRELHLDEARQPPPRVIIDEAVVEGNRAVVRWSAFAYRGSLPTDQVETRYRVNDGPWSAWSTTRAASFEGLRPGTQTIAIQAKGLFVPVEPVSAQTSVTVDPPVLLRPLVVVPLVVLSSALLVLGIAAVRRKREHNRERGVAQAALRASEERFATAFRASPDPVAIFTFPEGRVVEVNQGFEETTGWARSETVGRTCTDLGIFDDTDTCERFMLDMQEHGRIRSVEFTLRTRGGTRRAALISAETIRLAGERHVLWVATDVTEKRSLEAQLIHAQKMEAIGQLAGGVAHDFNNLLTAILGHAELLSDSLESPSARADVQEIHRAARRAAELTGQLLTFARKRRSEPRVLDLNELVGSTDRMLRRLLGERITMKVDPAPRLASVRVDPGHVEQVLVNLVVNARDAMPEGGTVTIATRPTTIDASTAAELPDLAPGSYIELSVTDTGTGIAPELGNRIFEPFFTTKDVGKGTGLGLAICYGIVREAGGTIAVSSAPGEGATFRVLFPVVDVTSESAGPAADVRIPRGSETILLVEDEDAVRTLLCRVLSEAGYNVLPAASGDDALEVLAAADRTPDLLITDVVLPGRMGPEVAAEVRRRVPTVSVLYVSGYAERGTGPAAALDGPLLAKPFTRVSIAQKVREILDAAVATAR